MLALGNILGSGTRSTRKVWCTWILIDPAEHKQYRERGDQHDGNQCNLQYCGPPYSLYYSHVAVLQMGMLPGSEVTIRR